jgi:hypothetical protein
MSSAVVILMISAQVEDTIARKVEHDKAIAAPARHDGLEARMADCHCGMCKAMIGPTGAFG